MSRKGKAPIPLPKGVEIKFEGQYILVKGPKGTLSQRVMPMINVDVQEDQIVVSLKEERKENSKFHGLYRSLIHNMVVGVTEGFEKKLEMIGVGYRAVVQGTKINLQVGYSHPTELDIPQGIEVKVEKNTKISVSGADKQKVGQFAADIRAKRPPEPYKGKGVRYSDEFVRRKAGKSAAKAG